jgi:hypothetical protein
MLSPRCFSPGEVGTESETTMTCRWPRSVRPVVWLSLTIALGLALRLYHYLRDPAMWHDEAALVLNVLHKSYPDIWGPRLYAETGPPLFLWAEKAVVDVLGDGTFALRLMPFVASCLALLVVYRLGRRFLSPSALWWLVLLFACSDRLLWHCCEAKPYATDVLVAAGLLLLFARSPVAGSEGDPQTGLGRRIALFTALTPLLIFFSYPASFLLAAAAIAWLPAVYRTRRPGLRALYILFGAVLVGSFLLLITGPVRALKNDSMLSCWDYIFPDWERPWAVPGLAGQRLSEVFRYACEPTGNLLLGFALIGGMVLWRSGQQRLLAFLTLPLALAGAAWLLGQYPFGAARVMAFAAPAALVLVSLGLPPAFAWLRRHGRAGGIVLAGILLVPLGQAAFRVALPWDRLDCTEAVNLVLRQRMADEPVVGSLFEHTYYFRQLGSDYRAMCPSDFEVPSLPATLRSTSRDDGLTDPYADRIWLIASHRDSRPENYVSGLAPAGQWCVVEQHRFRNTSVLYLKRERAESLAAGP